MRALVLSELVHRASLAGARALSSDGWIVGSGDPHGDALTARSRAVSHRHLVPAAHDGLDALVAATNRATREQGYEVVFACDDAAVLGLSAHREELDVVFPYGPHESVVRGFDKLHLLTAAAAAGLAVPRTEIDPEAALASLGIGPVVVKPRLTFLEGSADRVSVMIAPDLPSARARAAALQALGAEPLFQERLEGRLMAFAAVTNRDAQIVARVQQVSDLIWPAKVGVSARAHTVPVDERLALDVGRLLETIGWCGLAELQFILGEDGVPRLVDLNGRFYGSMALAVGAGVNLPGIWARLATGEPLGRIGEARAGTRYQWFNNERRARASGRGPVGGVAAAARTLGGSPFAFHSVGRASDPMPALSHLSRKLIGWIRRS